MGEKTKMVKKFINISGVKLKLITIAKLKDNNLNDERFLRMIEAMYGGEESKLETKLLDYDHCANLGSQLSIKLQNYFNN